MKINKQPKAQMHAAGDLVDTGASQGVRRATEDAPVSRRPLSPSVDSEVVPVAKLRNITNAARAGTQWFVCNMFNTYLIIV